MDLFSLAFDCDCDFLFLQKQVNTPTFLQYSVVMSGKVTALLPLPLEKAVHTFCMIACMYDKFKLSKRVYHF